MVMEISTNGRAPAAETQRQAAPKELASVQAAAGDMEVANSSVQAAQEKPANDGSKLPDVVKALNEYVQNNRRNLEFSIDEDSGRSVVKVMIADSGEVVRQMPTEEALRISNYLQSQMPDSNEPVIFQAEV
jgi:flagellar protein FlaG